MITVRLGQDICACPPCAVALGSFDGLHLGHMRLMEEVKRYAAEHGICSAVWSIDGYGSKSGQPYIISSEQRNELLESFGIDCLFLSRFDEIKNMSGEEFVCDILKSTCCAQMLCCGFNFTFGKNAASKSGELVALGKKYGCDVSVVDEVKRDGMTVSSTLIRRLIADGDMSRARQMLTRPFSIKLNVVHGYRLGRTLDFPTINQNFPQECIIPRRGVYICRATVDGVSYPACANVGTRPSVGGDGVNCETHIIGYDGDLYGRPIQVDFYEYLREEKKFPSLDALKEEIRKNVISTIEYFKA